MSWCSNRVFIHYVQVTFIEKQQLEIGNFSNEKLRSFYKILLRHSFKGKICCRSDFPCTTLKGVFAKNERGFRHASKKGALDCY